ncbi:MAG: GNAT family N-acetyltransferase [Saprospiraceae bacterium]
MLESLIINNELRLRQMKEDDLPNLALRLNHPQIANNTQTIPYPYSLRDAEFFFEKIKSEYAASGTPKHWIVEHCELGLVGGVGVSMKGGAEEHKDEIGYAFGAAYWGRGFATAAVRALTAMQFETRPSLVRMEAWVYAYNPASVRVLEKSGYRREGYCRSFFVKNDRCVDAWLLARLREDCL